MNQTFFEIRTAHNTPVMSYDDLGRAKDQLQFYNAKFKTDLKLVKIEVIRKETVL